LRYFRSWTDRPFPDPQVVILAVVLPLGPALVVFADDLLAPLIASVIIAYLMEEAVRLLVFFMLKDKALIVARFLQFVPRDRPLPNSVWREVDAGIAHCVKGKVLEILIAWVVSCAVSICASLWSLWGVFFAIALATLVAAVINAWPSTEPSIAVP